MYRVQYLCPRSGNPNWQNLTEGWIWQTPRTFASFPAAQMACDSLIWQYHAARVIDPSGQVVYQT